MSMNLKGKYGMVFNKMFIDNS